MTLDAQAWVWQHSRTRGNARLVLLAVADAVTGPEATARVGMAELTRRLNASKGAAVEAVRRAVACGELVVDEPAAGSRAALYRLPGAVGYVRRTGRESGPVQERSGNPTTTGLRSGNPTTTAPNSGPDSRPQRDTDESPLWSGNPTASGRETGPHHAPRERVSAGVRDAHPRDLSSGNIPPFARPLVDQMTAAGVVVRWDLAEAEWFTLDALLKRSGADMLAAHAARTAQRRSVAHARYFLRAWRDLPPTPAPGTTAPTAAAPGADVIPLDRRQPRKGRAAQAADWYADLLAEEH